MSRKGSPAAPTDRHQMTRQQLIEQLEARQGRRDIPQLFQRRLKLIEMIGHDLKYWYARAKFLAENATKDTEPQVRMVMNILGKIAPDRREVESNTGMERGHAPVLINIGAGLDVDVHQDRTAQTIETTGKKLDA